MDSNERSDFEWRSADSNSDILHEESITEPISDEFNLYSERYPDNLATDTVMCNKPTADEDNIVYNVEEGLLNAMHNLQIASARKVQRFRDPMMVHKNAQGAKKTNENEPFKEEQVSVQTIKPETAKNMSNKAIKLLSTEPIKKATKSKTESDITVNQLSASRVVKTISNSENGIQLKNEKINFFGIPVTVDRKKRTQVKPFNFQNRMKKNQQLQESDNVPIAKSSLSMKSGNPVKTSVIKTKFVLHSSQNITKIDNKKNQLANSTVNGLQKMEQTQSNSKDLSNVQNLSYKNITMRKFVASEHAQKMNKENNMYNNNSIESQKIKQKAIATGLKSHIDQRAKDRQIFNEKLRQRTIEIEEMRARVEQKKREKAKLEKIAPRKKI
ncbi:hypothetical protein PV325_005136 [Microctonus aethiopoides]|uniref:Uncharacterized protein n=1 Tax=Microctonus aethiopoides TaxID=144406 RepID=A0AA39KRP1_9HYME|nr:hypothetical protein PV325_005136 [Microctonus aethiopoides]KAK0099103.1 hypothetical protein PV326_006567 [Microctonus aethiopoides]KAK0171340.1 hypothetical protein PV328_009084 [Microctonus aethiopoides]